MKITVELNEKLTEILNELSTEGELPKASVIRRALALLKYIEDERKDGLRLTLSNSQHEVVKEIVMAS